MADDKPRLARLTAILNQLKTKKIITAKDIAEKHEVSIRTVYRDIRTLEKSGVPIITEEGKGYSIMDGYTLPPIMFTESEAFALITAEQLILGNKDTSFIKDFTEAIAKIKAILRNSVREKSDYLQQKIIVRQNLDQQTSSNYLSMLQVAIINSQLVKIEYSDEAKNITIRMVEPFVLYNEGQNWILFAFCRLRADFRAFRLDRIKTLSILNEKFEPQKMTFQEFIEKQYSTPDI